MAAQVVPGGAIAVRNGRKNKKAWGPVTPPDRHRTPAAGPAQYLKKVDKAPQSVN
jgi:hypothetical protein